ncbi:hypothetical protein E2C01_069814 [Portunus trituberculatus]|uniref:Uncharacterized protein n=1 Tax=Portunus trituberculatus TaxID=210409 RepID=A0A5B7I1V3_PORTR|nr:hypothetical protein [Portunus trituberculatus]
MKPRNIEEYVSYIRVSTHCQQQRARQGSKPHASDLQSLKKFRNKLRDLPNPPLTNLVNASLMSRNALLLSKGEVTLGENRNSPLK